MDKVKLEMDFLDEIGKRFRIGIDNPKEDLDDIAVKGAMETVINEDVFLSNDTSLVEKEGARFITTSVREVELEP